MNYREEIEKRMAERKRLGAEIDDLRAQWASEVGPKPGDTVMCNRYSYRGQPMVVDRVTVKTDWSDRWQLLATGFVLNKDGTPGKRVGEYVVSIPAGEDA